MGDIQILTLMEIEYRTPNRPRYDRVIAKFSDYSSEMNLYSAHSCIGYNIVSVHLKIYFPCPMFYVSYCLRYIKHVNTVAIVANLWQSIL